MISENTYGQSSNNGVGMKSTGNDFEGMDVISLRTSSTDTVAIDSHDLSK